MFKNYVIKKDGRIVDNIGGMGLTAEEVRKMYPTGEIIEVPTTDGIVTGFPVAAYNADYSIKSIEQLKSEGLDENGQPFLTDEELEWEIERERIQKQEQKREDELSRAEQELGAGEWSGEQVEAKAWEIEKRELQEEIARKIDTLYVESLGNRQSDLQLERYKTKFVLAKNPKDNTFTQKQKNAIIAKYLIAYHETREKTEAATLFAEKLRRVLKHAAQKAQQCSRLTVIDGLKKVEKFSLETPQNELDKWAKELGGWINTP